MSKSFNSIFSRPQPPFHAQEDGLPEAGDSSRPVTPIPLVYKFENANLESLFQAEPIDDEKIEEILEIFKNQAVSRADLKEACKELPIKDAVQAANFWLQQNPGNNFNKSSFLALLNKATPWDENYFALVMTWLDKKNNRFDKAHLFQMFEKLDEAEFFDLVKKWVEKGGAKSIKEIKSAIDGYNRQVYQSPEYAEFAIEVMHLYLQQMKKKHKIDEKFAIKTFAKMIKAEILSQEQVIQVMARVGLNLEVANELYKRSVEFAQKELDFLAPSTSQSSAQYFLQIKELFLAKPSTSQKSSEKGALQEMQANLDFQNKELLENIFASNTSEEAFEAVINFLTTGENNFTFEDLQKIAKILGPQNFLVIAATWLKKADNIFDRDFLFLACEQASGRNRDNEDSDELIHSWVKKTPMQNLNFSDFLQFLQYLTETDDVPMLFAAFIKKMDVAPTAEDIANLADRLKPIIEENTDRECDLDEVLGEILLSWMMKNFPKKVTEVEEEGEESDKSEEQLTAELDSCFVLLANFIDRVVDYDLYDLDNADSLKEVLDGVAKRFYLSANDNNALLIKCMQHFEALFTPLTESEEVSEEELDEEELGEEEAGDKRGMGGENSETKRVKISATASNGQSNSPSRSPSRASIASSEKTVTAIMPYFG